MTTVAIGRERARRASHACGAGSEAGAREHARRGGRGGEAPRIQK
jgi:hypothetical protein